MFTASSPNARAGTIGTVAYGHGRFDDVRAPLEPGAATDEGTFVARSSKEQVKDYWEAAPCGAADVALPEGGADFFDELTRQRFEGDDFMFDVVRFKQWSGKRVVEVGCGLATDLVQFAQAGADVTGTDLTAHSARLARRRLDLHGLPGRILVADAERLPLRSGEFDLVYSWGVIHHTPNTAAAAREIERVCRPGGRVLVMVYHRRSLFALQAWLYYALLRGRPFQSLSSVIAEHIESPDTKAYTRREARALFSSLRDVRVATVVTRYDVRVGRRHFLPAWLRRLVPPSLGWFLVIEGTRPGGGPAG
jgi:ubiquinone/menaquinone biosynthesis C-methylase UbiE